LTLSLPARLAGWFPYGPRTGAVAFTLILVAGLAIALPPLQIAAGLVAALVLAGLILVRPQWGLYALPFAVAFGEITSVLYGLQIPDIGEFRLAGIALSATDVFVALVALALPARLALRREHRLRILPLTLPLALWIAALAIGATFTPDEAVLFGLKELVKWLEFGVIFFATAHLARTPSTRRGLLIAILAAATLQALLGWAQFFLQLGPGGYALGPFMRAFGTFGQPNPFAGYLGLALVVGFGVLLATRLPARGPGALRLATLLGPLALLSAALGVVVVAILMSFSRGAWLGLALALAAMAVVRTRRAVAPIVAGIVLILSIGLLGAFSLLPEGVSERAAQAVSYFGIFDVRTVQPTTDNWAVVERMANWQAAMDMFLANPNTGVGLGAYSTVYEDYAIGTWQALPSEHAHNFYLNVLAEMGWWGAGSYLLFVAATVLQVVAILRRRSRSRTLVPPDQLSFDDSYAVALAGIGAMIVLHIHNTFDNLYVHSILVQVALILGLVSAADDRGTGARAEERGPETAPTRRP
jgi:O-antigen ligase